MPQSQPQQRVGGGVPAAQLLLLRHPDVRPGLPEFVAGGREDGQHRAGHRRGPGRASLPDGQGEPRVRVLDRVTRGGENGPQQADAVGGPAGGQPHLAEPAGRRRPTGLAGRGQAHGAVQQRRRPGQVRAGEGLRAGRGQRRQRAAAQVLGDLVAPAQLGPVPVGALQVRGRVRGAAQQARGPGVPVGPGLFGHRLVGHLVDHGAAEPAGVPAGSRLDQLAAVQPGQRARHAGGGIGQRAAGRRLRAVVRQRRDLRDAELAAQHRGQIQGGAFGRLERVDAGTEQRLQPVRQVPTAVVLTVFGGSEQLFQVERVAAGRVQHACRVCVCVRADLRAGRHDDLALGPGQRRKHEAVPARGVRVGLALAQVRAGQPDHQDGGAVDVCHQPVDDVEQRAAGPVAVVDQHDHRPGARDARQHGGDRGARRVERRAGRAVGEQAGRQHAQRAGVGCGPPIDQLAHGVGQRRQAAGLAVGPAPAGAVRIGPVDPLQPGPHQPGLTDTGLAVDGQQHRALRRRGERAVQRVEFPLAADERQVEAAQQRRVVGADAEQPVRRQRCLDPLERQRPDRFDPGRAADRPPGERSDEDLVRPGVLFQPGRDVHGVAGHQRLPAGHVGPGHRRPGVHADPHPQPHAEFGGQVVVEPGDRVAGGEGGGRGPPRVVLVHDGDAEDGHHRVADELLDGAAALLDRGPDHREVAQDDRAQRLRVERLGQRRRPDEVAEDDGDELAGRFPG